MPADCLTKAKIPFQPAVATVFCLVDLRKALAEPTWEVKPASRASHTQLPSTDVLHLGSSSVCFAASCKKWHPMCGLGRQ